MDLKELIWTIGSIITFIGFGIQIWMLFKMKHISTEVDEVENAVDAINDGIHEIQDDIHETNENRSKIQR